MIRRSTDPRRRREARAIIGGFNEAGRALVVFVAVIRLRPEGLVDRREERAV